MTKEEILNRIEELKKELDKLQANKHALIGAIQDCEYWFSKLKATEE